MSSAYIDNEKRASFALVTYILIAINIAIFVESLVNNSLQEIIAAYGLVPSEFLAGENRHTVFTTMFLHAGVEHLAGNMYFFWIFGRELEHRVGHFIFFSFYVFAGIAASLAHIELTSLLNVPVVGASGAIAGILGAYVVFFPRIFVIFFVSIWFLFQVLFLEAETLVAYEAHIGGFLAGLVVALFLRLIFRDI